MFGAEESTKSERPNMSTVGFSKLGAITRRTPDQLKKIPAEFWDDDEFEAGKRRRYDASHAISLILLEMLTARGETMAAAVEALSAQRNVIGYFLNDLAENRAEPRFVLTLHTVVEDEWTGVRFEGSMFGHTGTADEVARFMAGAIEGIGKTYKTRNGRTTERCIGGPYVAVASVNEAYRILKVRAEEAGFLIDGKRILPLGKTDDAAEETSE